MTQPTIFYGAAGSGKTAALIEAILETEKIDVWGEVWVLLPTRLQIDAFRKRLLSSAGQAAIFNVRFFEFYELYAALLDIAHWPQRTIGRSASDRILRQVIQEQDLTYYAGIADKPGFIKLVSEFVRELKQGLVTLDEFEQAARTPKDQDLAKIYRAYQVFLGEHHLADRDGEGWLAVRAVRERDLLKKYLHDNIVLLAVDGYDQFTPLQAALLDALAEHIPNTRVSLTFEENRQVSQAIRLTLERLKYTWHFQEYGQASIQQSALAHLEASLFTAEPESRPADDALHLIEAPDPYSEVRAVLRTVKRYLQAGIPPEEIAIVMRQVDPYADAIRSAAAAYDLPVVVRQEEQVSNNPAVAAVLSLIDLHALDFPRRQMLNVLRNPYLLAPDFSAEDINLIEQISMEKPIIGGTSAWINGLASVPPSDEDDMDARETPTAGLPDRMVDFVERITPPEGLQSARTFVTWIEGLLGDDPHYVSRYADIETIPDSFTIYQQVRMDDGTVGVRDVFALRGFRSAMLDVVSASDLLGAQQINWVTFRADLELALRGRAIPNQQEGLRTGRALATTVFEARGLPHNYIFLVGMAESLFPARQFEDPLYSDRQRVAMAEEIEIVTPDERNRENMLFYEVCALARERLILSRPSIDDKGNPWPASTFWKQATAILVDAPLEEVKLGVPPLPQDAANLREVAVGAAALNGAHDQGPYLSWLDAQPIWAHVKRGQALEASRESTQHGFDAYSGVLSDPQLIAWVAEKLGSDHLWSASQFNDLGYCLFRYFSKRILKLDKYEEPEAGLDVLQLGNIYHDILDQTYTALHGKAIAPENVDVAKQELNKQAAKVFAKAPEEWNFQASAVWEQEQQNILDKLHRLVELDFLGESPYTRLKGVTERKAFRQELPFGYKNEAPVVIPGPAGDLLAGGYIDRMDKLDDTEIVVADYKSGQTPTKADIEGGRNFQMVLYLWAAEQWLQRQSEPPQQVRAGLFWSINNPSKYTLIEASHELLEESRKKLHQLVLAARQGYFPSRPSKIENGKCMKHCEFHQLCRMSTAHQHKP